MNHPYRQIFNPAEKVSEEPQSYNLFTERHLQAVWLDQKYFKNFKSSEGEEITVISPGIWNTEAGPDFKKAHLRIGSRELKGDVEIHLVENHWYQHKHHLDERYENVVFHLSLWKPKSNKPILTKEGHSIPTGHLEHCLTIPLGRIVQLLDLDLYPYKKFIGSGNCAHALYRNLPSEKIKTLFHAAADWRLLQKQNHLESLQPEESLQLASGIAQALGYKNNPDQFVEIFNEILPYTSMGEEALLTLCLGISQFFEPKSLKNWETSCYYQNLKSIWEGYSTKIPFRVYLKLNQIRPLNHPIRRFVFLSKFLAANDHLKLYENLLACWKSNWKESAKTGSWHLLRKELLQLFPLYQDTYWNHHYNFELLKREEFLPLIGEDFKEAVLINTFFPLLRKKLENPHSTEERGAFESFYLRFSSTNSSKRKYLVHRFFGETPKGDLLNNALMEQGAFQIHKDFCIQFEASCEGCPFVEQYNNNFKTLNL